ncbi:MAG TPA: branched-chain amino acid ABC transporter permease [Armatimonadota bacterium]|nr:branched-chain amino acid ABC transporter permease [Armatimonadota bacterium]
MISSAPYLLQYLVSGITLGSIYGMIALGFTLIHNATGIVNFAQGEFVTYGALIAITCSTTLGLPMPLALLLAVAGVTLLGALVERSAIRPARGSSVITLIIITIGVSILLRGIAMWIWGPDALPMRHFSGETPMQIGAAAILPQHAWIMGIVLITMMALWLLGEKTQVGKAMRACAMDREAAQLVGIPATRMVMLSFAMSGMLGGLAGAIVAPLAMAQYNMGIMLGLKGFAAAILGGMGNPLGAVLGGLSLGILESLGAGLKSGFKDAIAFGIMLAVLLARPTGLLGRRAK